MDDLTRATAAELATALAACQVTSAEVTQAHLDRIAAVDDARAALRLNATEELAAEALAYRLARVVA